jgi:hypothetical protein
MNNNNRRTRQELAKLFIQTVKSLNNIENDYDLSQSTPEFCIHFFKNIINLKSLRKLHSKIIENQNEWIKEFIELNGILLILNIIDKYSNKHRSSYQAASLYSVLILSKCILCVKEILNSKIGMDSLVNLIKNDIGAMRTFSKGKFISIMKNAYKYVFFINP